jgi:hypothetical protein
MLIDINGDGLLDRVFDRNPKNDQQGLYVCLNTGHGFDSGCVCGNITQAFGLL